MGQRQFHCHYEVFCIDTGATEPAPPEVLEVVAPFCRWKRFTRHDAPQRFAPPAWVVPQGRGPRRQPQSVDQAPVAHQVLAQMLNTLPVGFEITVDVEGDDLKPFQAALGLAATTAQASGGGVIIDRTSDIGLTVDELLAQASAFNEDGDHDLRDTVVVRVDVQGPTATLRTIGLAKYGQRDLVLEGFPAQHLELGRALLYDKLGPYAALNAPLLAGQTMAFARKPPEARLFFTERFDGALLVTDCEATEKKAAVGLTRFVQLSLPAFEQQLLDEARPHPITDEPTDEHPALGASPSDDDTDLHHRPDDDRQPN